MKLDSFTDRVINPDSDG